MPVLTVVSKKNTGARETTVPSGRTDGLRQEILAARRSALLHHWPRTGHGGDVRALLDGLGPLLVKIMRAERGFIRLFADGEPGVDEDLGLVGLKDGDSIGITESAYMQRLLAGRFVRDGSTLLVPLLRRSRTAGFCCLDRRRIPLPFTEEDGHFIIGIGQAAMTLRDVRAPAVL